MYNSINTVYIARTQSRLLKLAYDFQIFTPEHCDLR